MKSSIRTSSLATASALLALLVGLSTSTVSAGPGPQYWNRPTTPAAPAKAPAAACAGCKTTVVWSTGDRGPAGKGIAGKSIVSQTHECSLCRGTVTTTRSGTKNTMTHATASCATIACCK